MFGWIHESIRQLIIRKHGQETWEQILSVGKFSYEDSISNINKYYEDQESFRLVRAVSTVLGVSVEDVWEAYGGFLITFTMETGWDELLRALAFDLEGFLESLDGLHYFIDRVVYQAHLKGPSFRCEANDDGSLILHYYSKRQGLYPIVKGVIREASKRIFNTEVVMKVQERKQESMPDDSLQEHVVFRIEELPRERDEVSSAISTRTNSSLIADSAFSGEMLLTLRDFATVFPHHICFDKELFVVHFGIAIKKAMPFIIKNETRLDDIMEIVHPDIPMSFKTFVDYRNGIFIMKMKHVEGFYDPSKPDRCIFLKGQMVLVAEGASMLYCCTPNVTTVAELTERRLFLSDIPLHDATRDLILLNQSRMSQVELNLKLEETAAALKKVAGELEGEKEKTDSLLKELLPASVADALRLGKSVDAREFVGATILFTDIVTFTNICAECSPHGVVQLLNDLYLRFDRLTSINDVYKVETIGDAYMVVGGVPEVCEDHAARILNMALGMLWESRAVLSPITMRPIQLRVGLHTGAVVAGVVGKKMPRYCLFGDTVNVASRMESHGIPCKIHVSNTTHKAVATSKIFEFEERGWVKIKGKGEMFTYFLVKNKRKALWEIIDKERGEENTIDGYTELHDMSEYGAVTSKPPADKQATEVGKQVTKGYVTSPPPFDRSMSSVSRFLLKFQRHRNPDVTGSTTCSLMRPTESKECQLLGTNWAIETEKVFTHKLPLPVSSAGCVSAVMKDWGNFYNPQTI